MTDLTPEELAELKAAFGPGVWPPSALIRATGHIAAGRARRAQITALRQAAEAMQDGPADGLTAREHLLALADELEADETRSPLPAPDYSAEVEYLPGFYASPEDPRFVAGACHAKSWEEAERIVAENPETRRVVRMKHGWKRVYRGYEELS